MQNGIHFVSAATCQDTESCIIHTYVIRINVMPCDRAAMIMNTGMSGISAILCDKAASITYTRGQRLVSFMWWSTFFIITHPPMQAIVFLGVQ